MSITPFWVSAFLDFAPGDFDRGVAFWRDVTGYAVSEPRGETDQFATLVPPDGDDYLRVQHLDDGPGRIHLDLHVDHPTIAAEAAIELGGHVLVRHEAGYVVLRSPGGLVFCFVSHPAAAPAAPPRPGRTGTAPRSTRSASTSRRRRTTSRWRSGRGSPAGT